MNRAEAMPDAGSRSTTEPPGDGEPPGGSSEGGHLAKSQVPAGLPAAIRPATPTLRAPRDLELRSRELELRARRRRTTTRRLVGL